MLSLEEAALDDAVAGTPPLAAAAGGCGGWYGTMGTEVGREAAAEAAALLLRERLKGSQSQWAAYITTLPRQVPALQALCFRNFSKAELLHVSKGDMAGVDLRHS